MRCDNSREVNKDLEMGASVRCCLVPKARNPKVLTRLEFEAGTPVVSMRRSET